MTYIMVGFVRLGAIGFFFFIGGAIALAFDMTMPGPMPGTVI